MKHTVVLFTFCFLTQNLMAQEYTPLIIESFERTEYYAESRGQNNAHIAFFWTIESAGDTIIHQKSYQSLRIKQNCQYNLDGDGNEMTTYSEEPCSLVGGIREEDKKIYFYKYDTEGPSWLKVVCPAYVLSSEEEHLLFDFGLKVGDSIELSEIWQKTYAIKIGEGVDSITGNKSHKMLLTNESIEVEWIEGYANSKSLFASYFGINLIGAGMDIYNACLVHDNNAIVKTNCGKCNESEIKSCDELVSTTSFEKNGSTIISPNPVNDIVLIKAHSVILEILVIDAKGHIIDRVHNLNERKNVDIDLSEWLSGVYFIRLKMSSGEWENHRIFKL